MDGRLAADVSSLAAFAVAHNQQAQARQVNIEVARKGLEMQKSAGSDLLQLLEAATAHLGKNFDARG